MIGRLRPRAPFPRSGQQRILVADDDEPTRSLVTAVLRDDGYNVVEARDGGRMLVHLARLCAMGAPSTDYDLLVSDIRMPIGSGLQILESLRQAQWHTPAIFMTAFGDDHAIARAESLHALVFHKPFDTDDLRAAVVGLTAGRALQRPA